MHINVHHETCMCNNFMLNQSQSINSEKHHGSYNVYIINMYSSQIEKIDYAPAMKFIPGSVGQ